MMNELDLLREKIDAVDRQLLPLFLTRMELCSQVADYKRSVGKPVLDREREKEVLEKKLNLLEDTSMSEEVYEFFSAIMSISRDRQTRELKQAGGRMMIEDMLKPKERVQNPTVAVFGSEGSYTEDAAIAYFGAKVNKFHLKAFEDVFLALEESRADYAVLPIENSYTGTIVEVMDLLEQYSYSIVGEVTVPIRHCLMGVKGAKLDGVKMVFSHEQGITQSREFLKQLGDVECETYFNTSLSARMVAEAGDPTKAAIAGRRNAELYGLEILAENINNSSKNTTRFIIVSKHAEVEKDCNKISAAFTLPHQSGELYRILACFARGGLNLLKLESRPIHTRNFEYMFFVDYTGSLLDEEVRRITNNVIEGVQEFKLLGNYKACALE